MKCEMCQQADAETAVRRRVGADEQELFVCRACAAASAAGGDGKGAASERPAPVADVEAAAAPLMGMILDAAFEIVGKALQRTEPACPACGITRTAYRKASRLGCPACYDAFGKELEAAILDMHRGLQHEGKAPHGSRHARQVLQLKKALDAAVEGQRYEEAIALRNRIRELDRGAEAEEGAAPC